MGQVQHLPGRTHQRLPEQGRITLEEHEDPTEARPLGREHDACRRRTVRSFSGLRPHNSIWLTLWDESSRHPSLATHVI